LAWASQACQQYVYTSSLPSASIVAKNRGWLIMATELFAAEQTWRCLWSRAAYDIISAFPAAPHSERVQVGAGWGLRSRSNDQQALLLHPSGNNRDTGDLALTILGRGTHVIPRCCYSYTEYLAQVADIIETTASVYLGSGTADSLE
jgi:hypothetical protein